MKNLDRMRSRIFSYEVATGLSRALDRSNNRERDSKILYDVLVAGETPAGVAHINGLTRCRVKQICEVTLARAALIHDMPPHPYEKSAPTERNLV